jgi:hypothetical protein
MDYEYSEEVFFTLVKEAKDYIRIRMEDTEKKVCVNISKYFVRNFDKRSRYAIFDHEYLKIMYDKEMRNIYRKEKELEMAYKKQLEEEKKRKEAKQYEMEQTIRIS